MRHKQIHTYNVDETQVDTYNVDEIQVDTYNVDEIQLCTYNVDEIQVDTYNVDVPVTLHPDHTQQPANKKILKIINNLLFGRS